MMITFSPLAILKELFRRVLLSLQMEIIQPMLTINRGVVLLEVSIFGLK